MGLVAVVAITAKIIQMALSRCRSPVSIWMELARLSQEVVTCNCTVVGLPPPSGFIACRRHWLELARLRSLVPERKVPLSIHEARNAPEIHLKRDGTRQLVFPITIHQYIRH